jgi:hypothetical protein
MLFCTYKQGVYNIELQQRQADWHISYEAAPQPYQCNLDQAFFE